MKPTFKSSVTLLLLLGSIVILSFHSTDIKKAKVFFPYKKAGLTERQAAAHLLNRFTYGAKPGDVEVVVKMGLEKWFLQQLEGHIQDDDLNERLKEYSSINLTNAEVVKTYPRTPQVLRMAIRDSVIDKDSVNKDDRASYKKTLDNYMLSHGMKPQRELFREFVNQKMVRAVYTNNQLQELMTDFWFNHFNVSITKGDCAEFIPAYERDVIRANAFGKFEDLVLATAKSPAMLFYLDNFSSSGINTNVNPNGTERVFAKNLMGVAKDSATKDALEKLVVTNKKAGGLNENYARELMELHTLGVDGGYTQKDVTEAARVLTGWTVFPMAEIGQANALRKVIDRIGEDNLQQRGFVHEGDFLFAANRHDNSEKIVLGRKFEAGGGYEEGVELIKMLANHTAAARFISRKIAVRFVCDNPSLDLITRMSKTFIDKKGDIKECLFTMVNSPEFWSKASVRQKTKSPFDLAVSAVRSLNADVKAPYQLYNWIEKMGQKLYYYQAPTGFPDKGAYWINTGSLLSRMNFGLALVSRRIPGIKVDLLALNNGHEPESTEDALTTYSQIILPERDVSKTIERLTPLINDPELEKKVEQAAGKHLVPSQASKGEMEGGPVTPKTPVRVNKVDDATAAGNLNINKSTMAQVVGIIIGSPEFQRK